MRCVRRSITQFFFPLLLLTAMRWNRVYWHHHHHLIQWSEPCEIPVAYKQRSSSSIAAYGRSIDRRDGGVEWGRGVVPGRRWEKEREGTRYAGRAASTPPHGVPAPCRVQGKAEKTQPGNLDHQSPPGPSVKCSPSDRVDRDWQRRFRAGCVCVCVCCGGETEK